MKVFRSSQLIVRCSPALHVHPAPTILRAQTTLGNLLALDKGMLQKNYPFWFPSTREIRSTDSVDSMSRIAQCRLCVHWETAKLLP